REEATDAVDLATRAAGPGEPAEAGLAGRRPVAGAALVGSAAAQGDPADGNRPAGAGGGPKKFANANKVRPAMVRYTSTARSRRHRGCGSGVAGRDRERAAAG